MFCFFTLLFSFCFFFDTNCLWTISFSRSILFHILRYFHFCWSIGISFLVWSFYFIVKYVLFLTLLSFICFVPYFNCLWTILFWRSILFHILRYFYFCWSIGIRVLVWFLFLFISRYVLFLTFLFLICFVFDINCLWTISFLKKYLVSDCEIFSFLLKYWYELFGLKFLIYC